MPSRDGGPPASDLDASGAHPDEVRSVEDHQQTQQKLDLMRVYWGTWASILASSRAKWFDTSHLFLVDAFAGAGLHGSREHPDGQRFGTALSACDEARKVQRRHPALRVHVRLIDIDRGYCGRLQERTEPFRIAPPGPDRVDVLVIPGPFAEEMAGVLAETDPDGRQYRSLWLLDPYSVEGIPHEAVAELERPKYGPEVLVNLHLAAVWRLTRAGQEGPLSVYPLHEAALDRLYGRDAWRTGLRRGKGEPPALAQAYADTFRGFEHRGAYPLRKSGNEMRFFVHLTHSRTAAHAFAEAHHRTENVGLFAGRALNEVARAQAAEMLFRMFASQTVTVAEMYEADTGLDRGQLRVVCEAAADGGYGTWTPSTTTMVWAEQRAAPQQRLPL
jgi:three-Cys-motif partner protein